MAVTTASHCLLQETDGGDGEKSASKSVLKELAQLAFATDSLPDRSRILFQQLRKMVGQPRMVTCLHGLQSLAQRNEPAGARLLAAFLDANTPGARLIPRIHSFSSCRRIRLRMGEGADNALLRNWEKRFQSLEGRTQKRSETMPGIQLDTTSGKPGSEPPYPLMRRCLRYIVASLYRQGKLSKEDQALMAELARLEVDAYQERISQLASEIDPFCVTAVIRVLPLLSRADAEIRDLRQFLAWIEAGEFQLAFHKRVPRSYEVMDEKERVEFVSAIIAADELVPLSELQEGLQLNAIPVPQLAACVARLMALTHQLRLIGLRHTDMDLLTAVKIVQRHEVEGELRLRLSPQLLEAIKGVLIGPTQSEGLASWPLTGFELDKDVLVLRLPGIGLGDRVWRDDLPVLEETNLEITALVEEEISQDKKENMQTAAIKRLVLNNMGTVSVMMGFLRNPKIVAIPGLVASVAQRCRSVQVLEVIAMDRKLYTGFANQDVPLCLIRNPCNISVKSLRKFIHVKYISKVELRRIAKDKAGIRPEVLKEINVYLKSLA